MNDNQSQTKSLLEIVAGIRNRTIMLPEFQRDFRWELEQTYDLFDSLIRDIFIGTIIYGKPSFAMTLRDIDQRPRKGKGSSTALRTFDYPIEEIRRKTQTENFRIVLDGQQRITSIFRALVGIDTVYAVLRGDIDTSALSPILTRKRSLAEEIAALDVSRLAAPRLPRKAGDAVAMDFTYKGYDIITLKKMVERDYKIPEVQTSQEVISYYGKRIASDLKLPSQFAALVPRIREFLQEYAFGERVDLDDPAMIKAVSHPVAQHVTVKAFEAALREAVVEEQTPVLERPGRHCRRPIRSPGRARRWRPARPCSTWWPPTARAERTFARFLKDAPDVERFAKLPTRFNFTIPYTDAAANLRYYEPDFLAVTTDGVHHLIETKGREDIDVKHKDRAAQLWCENASRLTGTAWQYTIVHQREFERLRPDEFADLIALEPVVF